MTTMPQPSAPTSSYTAVYDAWNRLVSLTDGATTVGQYAYDGANRRTTKLVSGTTRHFYYSAAWQVLEERIGTSNTADRQFVWGLRYIDDLVLRDRGTERLYCLQDPNWNVTALSDSSGTIQERYSYAPYATPSVLTGIFASRSLSSYDWETLYAGYRFARDCSLFYVRNRWYSPPIGSWTSRDPVTTQLEAAPEYEYVHSSPLQVNDYNGFGYPVAWSAFPGYGQAADTGILNFQDWANKGSPNLARFVGPLVKSWGSWVTAEAKRNCVPEALLWGVLLAELAQFDKNDYGEWGASLGPAQLTAGIVNWYDLHGRYEDGTPMSPGKIGGGNGLLNPFTGYIRWQGPRALSDPHLSISLLGDQIGKQLDELCIAARGGARLITNVPAFKSIPAIGNGFMPWKSINTSLNGGFKANAACCSRKVRCKNPSSIYNILELRKTNAGAPDRRASMATLVGLLDAMNNIVPGATGNPGGLPFYGQANVDTFGQNQATLMANIAYSTNLFSKFGISDD
jgi:RHS repeat-associated protein